MQGVAARHIAVKNEGVAYRDGQVGNQLGQVVDIGVAIAQKQHPLAGLRGGAEGYNKEANKNKKARFHEVELEE